ncbi:hypothetical protein [Antribacter gilvus]|uniref:hypothetical protein n=1 Tax=Antribacter gilvus TaxID=2304675 RepID=UPI000F7A7594|nr:hypothetical protein [Antribacter gilvus]
MDLVDGGDAPLTSDIGSATAAVPTDGSRAHGPTIAGIGVLLGLLAGGTWGVADSEWRGIAWMVMTFVVLAGLLGLVTWRGPTTTWPRPVRRAGTVALAISAVLEIAVVTAVHLGGVGAPHPLVAAAAGFGVALPALLAGHRLFWGSWILVRR